jgi:hypothetical protein
MILWWLRPEERRNDDDDVFDGFPGPPVPYRARDPLSSEDPTSPALARSIELIRWLTTELGASAVVPRYRIDT